MALRDRYRALVEEMRNADDFDDVSEVTQPTININVGSGPKSESPKLAWHADPKTRWAGIILAILSGAAGLVKLYFELWGK